MRTTVSLIKADVGGFPGHANTHPALKDVASGELGKAKRGGLLLDYHVLSVGDDLQLLMSHTKGIDNKEIHELAWNTFKAATNKAKELKLYGAGQDLLIDSFSGNIRGMGPGSAEMEIEERKSEPLIAFMMDKTEPGAFNLPIYKMFASPENTAGLVIDPTLHDGFKFEVWDILEHKRVFMNAPEEVYSMLALIGAKSRYVIKRVFHKNSIEPAAVISTDKLYQIAGEYVGKDDPVALVRGQSGFPAVGEILEAFSFPHLVSGWMRGSHNGPLMPVSFDDAMCTRFDGPPRVVAAGFQVNNGTLVGPADMFDDPAFDYTRIKAQEIAEYMRRHGPFEPHRLPMEDMEYTTLPKVMINLKDRFEDLNKKSPLALEAQK